MTGSNLVLKWRGSEREFGLVGVLGTVEKWHAGELGITLIAESTDKGTTWLGRVDPVDDEYAMWMINASLEYASDPQTALDTLQGRIDSVKKMFSLELP